jgi:hypothetical protein
MGFVSDIRSILNNDENLRAAFFSGRTDYLGLGNWSQPPNVFGAAVYMTLDSAGSGFVRAHYGRLVFGQTGRFQLHAGADFTYLHDGSRIGLGPDFSLQYSWPNAYISTGLGAQVTAATTQPFTQTVRLDLLPQFSAGVRINMVRIGAQSAVLIPTAGAPGTDRTARFLLGLGASVEF